MSVTAATPDLHLLTSEIKQRALGEGFDKVGVIRADALTQERHYLDEWLARGYHGEMKWMARDPHRRTDPREIFPAARSVVVVALNYYTQHTHSVDADTGKVSRYAWGDDYHDVMTEKLRALLSSLQGQVLGLEGKICVDIQPMMDKAWAARAGLGWIGKHSNLITPELGSWVFIGELLLNVDLDYDCEPVDDHCGTCTLCLEACPTNAITEPYVVDSTRCISYGTIELRDERLPDVLERNLEGWLYGCDICQDVCPWNRFEQPTSEPRFEPRAGNISAKLSDILELTPETYADRFRRSAMKRTKLSGLQRNARALLTDSHASAHALDRGDK